MATPVSDQDYIINAGTKLVQIVIVHGGTIDVQFVDELGATRRGDGGFGSTDALFENAARTFGPFDVTSCSE